MKRIIALLICSVMVLGIEGCSKTLITDEKDIENELYDFELSCSANKIQDDIETDCTFTNDKDYSDSDDETSITIHIDSSDDKDSFVNSYATESEELGIDPSALFDYLYPMVKEKHEINISPDIQELVEYGYTYEGNDIYSRDTISDDGVDITYIIDINEQKFKVTDGEVTTEYDYVNNIAYGSVCYLNYDDKTYGSLLSDKISDSECKGVAESMSYMQSVFEKEIDNIGISVEDLY